MKLRFIALAASAVLSAAALAGPYNYANWTSSTKLERYLAPWGESASHSLARWTRRIGVTIRTTMDLLPSDFTSSTVSNAPALSDNFIPVDWR